MARELIMLVLPVVLAFILDFFLGDPERIPHPIVYIGKLISFFTKILLKKEDSDSLKFIKGIIIIIAVMSISLTPIIIIDVLLPFSLKLIYRTIMLYFAIALRTLGREAEMVEKALKRNLMAGQKQVARIVGRDTSVLDETGVIKATIETVAENTSDGIIAPYFYYAIFGLPGAYIYKVANTFDSMIAYHNEKFEYFGKAAAVLDDILNLIPSRITGLLGCLLSPLCGGNIKESFKIFFRDRYNHKSPNSAQCESAFAGALGVELLGDAVYEGKVEKKAFVNRGARTAVKSDIGRAVKLMNYITICFVILSLILKVLIILIK